MGNVQHLFGVMKTASSINNLKIPNRRFRIRYFIDSLTLQTSPVHWSSWSYSELYSLNSNNNLLTLWLCIRNLNISIDSAFANYWTHETCERVRGVFRTRTPRPIKPRVIIKHYWWTPAVNKQNHWMKDENVMSRNTRTTTYFQPP